MRYLRDKTAAKDVVQECFISLWQTRARIDESRSLKSYLYKMVRNRSLNSLRDRASVEVNHDLVKISQQETADNSAEINPASRAAEKESDLESIMSHWISNLPERQQEAFQLSRFEGLDHDEIAIVMNVSPKTVNNHIVAALSTLREKYEEYTNTVNE